MFCLNCVKDRKKGFPSFTTKTIYQLPLTSQENSLCKSVIENKKFLYFTRGLASSKQLTNNMRLFYSHYWRHKNLLNFQTTFLLKNYTSSLLVFLCICLLIRGYEARLSQRAPASVLWDYEAYPGLESTTVTGDWKLI